MEVVLLPLVSPGSTVNPEASDTDSVVEQDDLESAVYTEDDWEDTASGSVGTRHLTPNSGTTATSPRKMTPDLAVAACWSALREC